MIEKFRFNDVEIFKFTVGPLFVNSYLITNLKGEGIVIDPGAEGEKIVNFIKNNNIELKYLINTHGHPDHTGNNWLLKENFPDVKTGINYNDLPFLDIEKIDLFNFREMLNIKYIPSPDFHIDEGDLISLENISIKILHTPGHSPGSVILVLSEKIIFSGDTLFRESIGRTDLPGGNYSEIIKSIREKILKFPDDTDIFPGHGETTFLGHEKENNPFLC